MPKRKRIRRRKKEVEDYDEVEDLDAEELEEEELEEEELEEEELEEEAPAPKRSRRKRRAPRVVDEDDEGYGDDEEEFSDVAIATAPKATTKKSAKKPAKKTSTEPKVVEVKKVDDSVAEGVFSELLEAMAEGQAIIAVRLPGNQWQFMTGDIQTTSDGGVKLTGKEYYDEVQTVEYQEFAAEWGDLTYQEKVKKAKKMKVKWETHKDNRVDNIRLMLAVREKLGIEKYKEDYINKSARDRLRGK